MFALFLIAVLQQPAQQPHDFLRTQPQVSVTSPEAGRHPQVPVLQAPTHQTTPTLSPDSDVQTHLEMERDLGSHEKAIGDLSERVGSLEKLRQDPDRKDIDDLKSSRDHFEWTWGIAVGILGVVSATLWGFKKIIWNEIVKPRLVRELR